MRLSRNKCIKKRVEQGTKAALFFCEKREKLLSSDKEEIPKTLKILDFRRKKEIFP